MSGKKTVYLATTLEVVHSGLMHIITEAEKLGEITVGLLTDEAIASYKKIPFMNYSERYFVIKKIKGIKSIIPQKTRSYKDNLIKIKPDFVVHGDQWKNDDHKKIRREVIRLLSKWGGKLIEIPYKEITLAKRAGANEFIGTTTDIRRSRLRRLIYAKQIVRILETHSPLSALIAEKAAINTKNDEIKEFDGFWSSSLTDSTLRGKPDIEAVESSSRMQTLNDIFEVTTKPLIYDADTGGKNEHFAFTVRNLERLGVSAVIIEDKVGLKRNSLFGNDAAQEQETIENFCKKIKVGKNSQITSDFMIIARIESLILDKGIKDAISRAKKYIKAGADAIMIHSRKKTPGEIIAFSKQYKKIKNGIPLVSVPTSYHSITENELIKLGFKVVIYANHMLRASYPAMQNVAHSILMNGRSLEADDECMPIKDILELIPNNKD